MSKEELQEQERVRQVVLGSLQVALAEGREVLGRLMRSMVEATASEPDENDQGSRVEEANRLRREIARADNKIKLILAAVDRWEVEYDGHCAVCGVEIPLPRLELVPWVRECIDCASAHELRTATVGNLSPRRVG